MGETPEKPTTPGETPESGGEMPDDVEALKARLTQLDTELASTRQALTSANAEAAQRRHRLNELEAAEEQRKQAQMSELERAQEQITALQRDRDLLQQQYQDEQIRSEVRAVASNMHFKNPDVAYLLVDMAGIVIDPDKGVTGVKEALEALANKERYLLEGDFQRPTPPQTDAGAGNAPASGGGLTDLEKRLAAASGMTEAEYAKMKATRREAFDPALAAKLNIPTGEENG